MMEELPRKKIKIEEPQGSVTLVVNPVISEERRSSINPSPYVLSREESKVGISIKEEPLQRLTTAVVSTVKNENLGISSPAVRIASAVKESVKEKPLASQTTALVSATNRISEILSNGVRFKNGKEYKKFFSNLIKSESKGKLNKDDPIYRTSYDRQVSALDRFASDAKNILFNQLIGTNIVQDQCESTDFKVNAVPSLPALDDQQQTAVRAALQNRLTLIQGQSGCGKTVTLLSIIYHLVEEKKGPILVCAYSNVVVDLLAARIEEMQIKLARPFAESWPSGGTSTQSLSLSSQMSNSTMMTDQQDWDDADVFCCTCIAAGDERWSDIKFHAIVIDDSFQATEPECIIPIALGCERLVIVGDPLGLRPIITCKKDLERSLFERLVTMGVKPVYLFRQWRMHPSLWVVPSYHYMQCSSPSVNGVSADERRLPDQILLWPNPEFRGVFCDVDGKEKRLKGYDFRNFVEVKKIVKLVTHMLQNGISADRIGVITQYTAQKDYLTESMEKCGSVVEVNKPDSYQGREKDFILISCVRSDGSRGLGSLGYMHRFLLALTRAKLGVIIVGNSRALTFNENWKNLLEFYQLHGAVIKT